MKDLEHIPLEMRSGCIEPCPVVSLPPHRLDVGDEVPFVRVELCVRLRQEVKVVRKGGVKDF